MVTSAPATPARPAPASSFGHALRRLYIVRFAFAIVWAGLFFATAPVGGPLITVLLIAYPLFDAGAVLWQLRAAPESDRSRVSEWVGVVVSAVVAVALGIASSVSLSAALAVWGRGRSAPASLS